MITIKANVDEFVAHLTDTSRTQVPFATSLTLNRCADESVNASKKSLPSKFIVRNNWISKGFRTTYASKTNLVTTISHLDPFMSLQEYGGRKDPLNANSVAVPIGARPTPTALTPQSKWPGRISRRFIIEKNGLVMEFARSGRKSKGKRRKKHLDRRAGPRQRDPNLKLMYVFKKSVPIAPKLGLTDTIKQTFDSRFGINFNGFLEYAVSTRRP
jgi:hypothetical protein